MKKLICLVFVSVIISLASAAVFAQKATRITFKRGARSATVSGSLSGYKSKRVFVIKVRAGQTMKTEPVGDKHISIWIEGPKGSGYEQDMAADCHDFNEVTPTAAGDYKFTIQECQKADAWKGTFKFKVSVH